MKRHRKQLVNVLGKKQLADVPVDGELYKADNREEYQRARSNAKHVSLYDVFADLTADATEAYEESQLQEALNAALRELSENDRQLVNYLYFDCLTEQETAAILNVSQQTVNRKKHRIIKKLRNNLIDWF